MSITQLTENKKQYLDLLLLADESESMIDRYLERGELFVLVDNGIKAVCVVTDEADGVCELKNIAVTPKSQRQGYGKELIEYLLTHYSDKYNQMTVGTGDAPSAVGFYKSCGFEYSHRIENFFTDNYDHQMIEDGVLLRDMVYLKTKNIVMNKEILFVLLNDFADWEGAYIAPSLSCGVEPGSERKYMVKTVSITKDPVVSIGGFKVLPDYGINDIPVDYAGVVLIGGTRWFTPEAAQIVPLVKDAIENKRLVAGICNASVFLGVYGFLNKVNHTSNGLDYLKQFAGPNYTGESLYMNEPAVRSGNIVTANGFSALEFCREILYALEADSPNKIERSYRMNKTGVWEEPEIKS